MDTTHELPPNSGQASAPSKRSRNWPWIVLGVFLAILVVRETGFVSVDFYKSDSKSSTQADHHSSSVVVAGGPVAFHSDTGMTSVRARRDSLTAQAVIAALSELHVAGLSVVIESIDLSGLFWLPLYKSGYCEYAASYRMDGNWSLNGRVQGQISCDVQGLCSVHTYRRKIGRMVASEIEKEIRSKLR
jgi:hypothetical protein